MKSKKENDFSCQCQKSFLFLLLSWKISREVVEEVYKKQFIFAKKCLSLLSWFSQEKRQLDEEDEFGRKKGQRRIFLFSFYYSEFGLQKGPRFQANFTFKDRKNMANFMTSKGEAVPRRDVMKILVATLFLQAVFMWSKLAPKVEARRPRGQTSSKNRPPLKYAGPRKRGRIIFFLLSPQIFMINLFCKE